MKFLFDMIPLLLFFAAYKFSGWNAEAAQHIINTYLSGIISGGSVTPEQSPIVIATLVGILATMAQIAFLKLRKRKVDGMLWFSLAMFVVFGGLTIYLHDEDFIKWKLSIVYWLFAELEQKVEGLLDAYTDLKNPDFARVAEAMGIHGIRVEKASQLEEAVQAWLAYPGPALLDVTTDRFELMMPPAIEASQVLGTALYSAKAVLSGRGADVVDMIKDNFIK